MLRWAGTSKLRGYRLVRGIASTPKSVWALLFFITLSSGLTYPFVAQFGDRLRGDGDSDDYEWEIDDTIIEDYELRLLASFAPGQCRLTAGVYYLGQ